MPPAVGHAAQAVGALGDAQRALLAGQLAKVAAALEPGLSRVTWASLAVPAFTGGVQKALDRFGALEAQVSAHAQELERCVRGIAAIRLFPPAPEINDGKAGLPGALGFCRRCEAHMQQVG